MNNIYFVTYQLCEQWIPFSEVWGGGVVGWGWGEVRGGSLDNRHRGSTAIDYSQHNTDDLSFCFENFAANNIYTYLVDYGQLWSAVADGQYIGQLRANR